ncbi:hypothetical protein FQA39_LY14691 [Lamprigera yunnana]|nr:hypothetical protein FQA39_LY14691 [Lamprigera yunnana]
MHKITKGLKKKKKGKKSKHKDEELFKPEELEAYRREHHQSLSIQEETDKSGDSASANDEWKKFNALTAGIDSFLKKTQDDLDRIKSTSFFQRVPPPSDLKNKNLDKKKDEEAVTVVKTEKLTEVADTGLVLVSESESEDEDEEDIFDTTYIDAIAAGEVKLAYIPESPTEQPEGDDPFDTSIAERAILGPAVSKKGKKLVPLGAAVEVLTGRVQAPTCFLIRKTSTRRTIHTEKDLLLGNFNDSNSTTAINPPISKVSLLNDDAPLPLADEPIDLSKPLYLTSSSVSETETNYNKSVHTIKDELIEDEDDKEFALLASESLTKEKIVVTVLPTTVSESIKDTWEAFNENTKAVIKKLADHDEILESDPFDTTFAENVVPGRYELKLIENEILNDENDFEFNPRVEENLDEVIQSKVSIQVTDPAGLQNCLDRISESELNFIQPEHRDLLGGSITDLSNLEDPPLKPKEQVDSNHIEYCDPFDTSLIDSATIPGQTELKFLEKEFLSDFDNSDEDFDPRADEFSNRRLSNAGVKVTFSLPLPHVDNIILDQANDKKSSKPLTPYYVRNDLLPNNTEQNESRNDDPFDTSFVKSLEPGKAELKVIEKELFQEDSSISFLCDKDFDPRDEKQIAVAKVVQVIKEICDKPNVLSLSELSEIDLLSANDEVTTKVLTPATNEAVNFKDLSHIDPFDTSIACNILPGKAELKILETELIHSDLHIKYKIIRETHNNFGAIPEDVKLKNIPDLLEHTVENISAKILTPTEGIVPLQLEETCDDPFDTSIANNICLGQTELKLLESELT